MEEMRVLREAMDGLKQQNGELIAQINRQNEAITLRDARDLIGEILAEAEIPDLTRKRLAEELIKRPALKDGQLDRDATTTLVREAVTAEQTYLAQVVGSNGRITGMGSGGTISPQWQAQAEGKLASGLQRLGLTEAGAQRAAAGR